jgi:hypothetical protein
MSLTDLRTYLKARIASVYPSLTEHDYPFTSENVSSVNFDSVYHIEYETVSSELSGCYIYRDEFSVTIHFFKKGYGKVKTALDSLLAIVETVRDEISNPSQSLTQGSIKKVWSTGIEFSNPANNQDYVIIRLRISAMHLADNNRE